MDRKEILAKVRAGELSDDEADRMLSELETPKRGTLYCKVSPKGAISVYGLQRMPVTLYVEQWERLIAFSPEITKFAEANSANLSRKSAN